MEMDCRERRRKLQELVDGALGGAQARKLEAHAWACPACGAEMRWLKFAAAGLSGLPALGPGPLFNQRVLSALGLSPAAKPRWLAYAAGSLLLSAGLSAALAALALDQAFDSISMEQVLGWARDPQQALAALELGLLQAGLRAFKLLKAFSWAGELSALLARGWALPAQAGLSSLIASILILVLAKPYVPRLAVHRR